MAPLSTRTITERLHTPWFNDEVKAQKRIQRQAERKWRKTKLQVHKEIFIKIRTQKSDTIKRLKRDFYLEKFQSVNSCREMFQISDKLLGNQKVSPLPDETDKDNCDNFINFFYDKIRKICIFLDGQPSCPVVFSDFDGINLCKFAIISEDDVKKCILSCSTKSCDLDPISTSLLKECLDVLLPYITNIFNTSLTSGIVPNCFKQAIIKPLLKNYSLDPNILSNYRPVSNLPFLSKVLERLVINQLMNHIKSNGLQELYQSAYKSMHSTESALLKVTSDILEIIDKKEVCLLTLLDPSAAFDTIDHDILLKRLNLTFGLSDTVLLWFKSYLSERFQSVGIGISSSHKLPLNVGVPQGSVLGPILFTLYTQPLSCIFEKYGVMYHLYADDTQIYLSGKAEDLDTMLQTVSECIREVKLWMTSNRLKLNDDKTDVMLVAHEKTPVIDLPNVLKVNESYIKFNDNVKNLGMILDNKFSMVPSINQLCKTLYFQIRNISKIRHFIPEDISKKLVTTLVLSKLDYCNSLFVGLQDYNIKRLQTAQNSAARLVKRQSKSCHITPLLRELHWLPVHARIHYKICLYVYKCLNNLAPLYLSSMIEMYAPTRSLRSSDEKSILKTTKFNYCHYGCRSFSFQAPKLWNALPKHIRDSQSIEIFKKNLKHHLFILYFD